ncbi:MAG: excalibur calcium-binding domain-containing protein, partial [Culicoidibacterales bacterium]
QKKIIKNNSEMKIKEQKMDSKYLPKIATVDVEIQKLNQEMQGLTAQNKELDIQLKSKAESEVKVESEAKAKAEADEEARKQAEAQAKADEEARKQAEAQAKADEEARKQAESQAESEVVPPEQSTEKFANCTELRAVYPDGVSAGHPAYQSKMDRDGDSWACE